MLKWFKTILAILLLPVCAGAAGALWRVLKASGGADTVWVATISGAACWVVVFVLLPKPIRVYVYGHELTHVLWVWVFGGRVKDFSATPKGGHVVVTKTNFVIALAPYFFPLYAVLVMAAFGLGNLIWGWRQYGVWFHLCLGAAYAFHLTLTWHVLQQRQSDIADQGYLFSAVVIFLGNVSVLLLGIPLLAGKVAVGTALSWWARDTLEVMQRLGKGF